MESMIFGKPLSYIKKLIEDDEARTPAPEPEVDEAKVLVDEILAVFGILPRGPIVARHSQRDTADTIAREFIAGKDAEIAEWKLAWEEARKHWIATNEEWNAEIDAHKETQSELATLRAENERLKGLLRWAHDTLYEINPSNYDHDEVCKLNDKSVEVILGIAPEIGETHGKSPEWWASRKAAERNTAEPDDILSIRAERALGNIPSPKASGRMSPGTNAGAVEVTHAAATSAQIYADFHCEDGSFNVTCAERLAAEFDKVRTEAEARGRREALEEARKRVWERLYPENPKSDWTRYARDRADAAEAADDELKRMMAGEK